MKADVILYSRSVNKDYRWIFIPSWLKNKNIEKLKILYDILDDDKSLFEKDFPPLISICLQDHWLVLYIIKTEYRDAHGRYIHSMQGLSFDKSKWRVINCFLPYIVDNYKDILSVYRFIDFDSTNEVENEEKCVDISFDYIYNKASERLLEFERDFSYKKPTNSTSKYSKDFIDLLKYIYSDKSNVKEFILGDGGISKKIFPNVINFNSKNNAYSNKSSEILEEKNDKLLADSKNDINISEENDYIEGDKREIFNEIKDYDPKESNSLEDVSFEVCEIFLEENKSDGFASIIRSAFKRMMDETNISINKYFFVAKNIVSNHIFQKREVSADIALKGRDTTDAKDENVIKFKAELDILVMKLLSDGWEEVSVTHNSESWWNYKFKRPIKKNH